MLYIGQVGNLALMLLEVEEHKSSYCCSACEVLSFSRHSNVRSICQDKGAQVLRKARASSPARATNRGYRDLRCLGHTRQVYPLNPCKRDTTLMFFMKIHE